MSPTENFTRRSNKIVCFGVFINDPHKELTLNIELCLPPVIKMRY